MTEFSLTEITPFLYSAAFGASLIIALFAFFMSTGKNENRIWRTFALLSLVNSVYCATGVFLNNTKSETILYEFIKWNFITGMMLAPGFMTFVYAFLKRRQAYHLVIAWIVGLFWGLLLIVKPEMIITKEINFPQMPVQYFHFAKLFLMYFGSLFGIITLSLGILYIKGRNLSEWNSIMKWIFPACIVWGISGMWDSLFSGIFHIPIATSWVGGLIVVVAFLLVVTSKSQNAFLIQEKHSLIMKDIEQARKIQSNLITKFFPKFGDIQISGELIPMDKLGGDYYEVNVLDHNHLSVFLSDVTGHGIASAFLSSMVKIFLEEVPKKDMFYPNKVLDHVNARLHEKITDWPVTGVYGVINKNTRSFFYSSAGHPPIILFRSSDKKTVELPQQGRLMGPFGQIHTKVEKVTLNKGDRMLIISDGFFEAINLSSEMYGMARLKKCFEKDNFSEIKDIISDVREFSEGAEQSDDMAALLIKVS